MCGGNTCLLGLSLEYCLPLSILHFFAVSSVSAFSTVVYTNAGRQLIEFLYTEKSTKIVNRSNGEITKGNVPPYSVVVPGTHKDLYAVHIIKTVDAKKQT